MAKKATKSIENGVLTVTFEGGEVVQVDVKNLKDEIKDRLIMHGLSQKIGDSYAGAADAAEAFECAKGVADDLVAGNWTSRVASGGPKATMLAEALAAATGRSLEEAATVLDGLDDEGLSNLKKHPVVKAKMAEIKAARALAAADKASKEASGVDLAGLGL